VAYYYLIAQLPFLVYEQKPPMSSQVFKELAATFISGRDAKLLNCLSLEGNIDYTEKVRSCGCSFIDKWREWERALRLNLAKHRAINIKRDDVSSIPSATEPMDAAAIAAKVTADEHSPLEAEHIIDKARWDAIDAFVGKNYFNRNYIFAYLLKILLLERHEVFNIDKGYSEYKSLYAEIIKSADNSLGESK
jgi:hypothetical protein